MEPEKPFDTTILRKAGLTESQAKGYLALIEHGALSPAELAEKTGENRTNGYMIADKLVSLGLATKQPGSKSAYLPENPTKLKQLLLSRQRELKAASDELSGTLPQLLSTYHLTIDKPGVLHLEGLDALRQVYDDIIKTGETLRILPSAYDRDDPESSALIDQEIARQRSVGIKTEVLLRREAYGDLKNDDLLEIRPSPLGALDTQVMLYGDNIALTTFQTGIVTTIITSKEVAATFQRIFQVLWAIADDRDTKDGT